MQVDLGINTDAVYSASCGQMVEILGRKFINFPVVKTICIGVLGRIRRFQRTFLRQVQSRWDYAKTERGTVPQKSLRRSRNMLQSIRRM